MKRLRDERGESLIEIMVTIMVMGIGMVGVVGAIGSSIIGSDAHRSLAQGEVVVRDYGEAIKTAAIEATAFAPCPDETALDPTPGTDDVPDALAGVGWHAEITGVEWWVPDDDDFPNGDYGSRAACESYYQSCPDYDPPNPVPGYCDAGHQRVTFDVWNSRDDYGKMRIEARVLTRRNDVT